MAQDTNVQNLIINRLTQTQYDNIQNPSNTELYFIPDNTELVTSISSSSTDLQYPSAKCMWDLIGDVESLINAL